MEAIAIILIPILFAQLYKLVRAMDEPHNL